METDWFKSWFNQDYVELYSKRDSKEALSQVGFLLRLGEIAKIKNSLLTLDVACGAGRHLEFLEHEVKNAFGLDLSQTLLTNTSSSLQGKLVIADMRRIPFLSGSLNLVTSFFTSFGYFSCSSDEQSALREFNRVLAPEGYAFFDLANKEHVVDSLVKEETIPYMHGQAHIKREILEINNQTRVKKTIELKKTDGQLAFHTEDVHLFDANELHEILKSTGFFPVKTYGGFEGENYFSGSERLIVLAKKV